VGSETLPSACYILSGESSIPFYSTSNGYNKSNKGNSLKTYSSSIYQIALGSFDPHKQCLINSKTLLQCNREDISTLLNALTGHCLIGTHAIRLGLSNHDFCHSCKQIDEEESIEHLLCFCPAHSLKRFQTLGSYTLPNLAAIQDLGIQKLLCFLRRTEYFAKADNPWARETDLSDIMWFHKGPIVA